MDKPPSNSDRDDLLAVITRVLYDVASVRSRLFDVGERLIEYRNQVRGLSDDDKPHNTPPH